MQLDRMSKEDALEYLQELESVQKAELLRLYREQVLGDIYRHIQFKLAEPRPEISGRLPTDDSEFRCVEAAHYLEGDKHRLLTKYLLDKRMI